MRTGSRSIGSTWLGRERTPPLREGVKVSGDQCLTTHSLACVSSFPLDRMFHLVPPVGDCVDEVHISRIPQSSRKHAGSPRTAID